MVARRDFANDGKRLFVAQQISTINGLDGENVTVAQWTNDSFIDQSKIDASIPTSRDNELSDEDGTSGQYGQAMG